MLIKDEFRDVKNLYVLPARGNGKSLYQAQLYKEFFDKYFKGDNDMAMSGFGDFVTKHLNVPIVKTGPDVNERFTVQMDPIVAPVEKIEVPEEEWIWVKGYKGTDKYMNCRSYHYELDKQFDMPEDDEISVCHNGFHFCKELSSVFGFYNIGDGNRFFEVEALVKKSEPTVERLYDRIVYRPYSRYEDKYAAKSIRFIRELTVDEVFAASRLDGIENWTDDQKKRAMATMPSAIYCEVRSSELVDAGYSQAFAQYIARNFSQYELALVLASQPELSMDVKVLAILMDNEK